MKIVVIGGTGLIGSKLVTKLRERGQDALAASPNTGVNSVTGEGLAEALEGASVVIDVSNAPSWEDSAVMQFFETSTRNLLSAEAAAGVRHHVALSVVGSERMPDSGYFRAKIAQENLIKSSPIPYTIVRAHSVLRIRKRYRRFFHPRQSSAAAIRIHSAHGGRRRRKCGRRDRYSPAGQRHH